VQFHEFGGVRIAGTELGKGLVQSNEFVVEGDVDQIFVREFAAAPRPALTLAALPANLVDQDAPHGFGGGGKEVARGCSTAGPYSHLRGGGRLRGPDGSLQRLAGRLLGHFLGGQLAQLIVDQRQELLRGVAGRLAR